MHADLHVTPGCGRTGKVLLRHDQMLRKVYTSLKPRLTFGEFFFFCGLLSHLLHLCVCVSEGNVEETVQYLEMLADISHSHGLEHNLPDAYLCLGNIYYAKV